MKEILNEGIKFESICLEILSKHVSYVESYHDAKYNNTHIQLDAIIRNVDNNEAIVEIKFYRSKRVSLGLIEKALMRLKDNLNQTEINNGLLILSTKMDAYYKEAFEIDYGINIIDIENIIYLVKDMPAVKTALFDLLGIKSDNEVNIKESEFNIESIFSFDSQYNIGNRNNILSSTLNRGELLYEELETIKAGKRAFSRYEKKCVEILKYLFDNSLEGWHEQQRTDDGINRFDLICRIIDEDNIWSLFSKDFKSRYLLFEFKNYSDRITQSQIYTTEKYLFAKALRNVAIIISREGPNANALKATDSILRENGKLILHINNLGLKEMLLLKDSGSDPADYLFKTLDNMLLKLSK